MTASTGLRAVRLEHSGAVPLAGQQGVLHVETVLLDRAAPPGDRLADPVFHRGEVQVQLLVRLSEDRSAAQENPQRLAQGDVTLRVRPQRTTTRRRPHP